MLTDEQRCQPSLARKWLIVQEQSCYYRLLKAFRSTDLKYASRDGGGECPVGGTRRQPQHRELRGKNDRPFFQMMPTGPKASTRTAACFRCHCL